MEKHEQIFSYINTKREEQGISKKEFAKVIGCTQRAFRYWELGERKISIDTADKALKVLGVSAVIGKEVNRVWKNTTRHKKLWSYSTFQNPH